MQLTQVTTDVVTSNVLISSTNQFLVDANNVGRIPGSFITANTITANLIQSVSNTAIIGTTLPGAGQVTSIMLDTASATGNGAVKVPIGNTAQRPADAQYGQIRYNTDTGTLEQYSSQGWAAIASPPAFTYMTPTTYNGSANTLITIYGSAFANGVSVQFIDITGNTFNGAYTTFINNGLLTTRTPQNFTTNQANLSVKIINSSGLSITTAPLLSTGTAPYFNVTPGALTAAVGNSMYSANVSATSYDNKSITYSITSGSLPDGLSLNTASGIISGLATNNSSNTFSFTLKATDSVGSYVTGNFSIALVKSYKVTFKLWGAGGGGGCKDCSGSNAGPVGGPGGYVTANTTYFGAGNTFTITVGGGGGNGNSTAGGYGGGGAGGSLGGGGGGATYVYQGSTLLLVAGSGGGNGGYAGYPNGGGSSCGTTATQSAGGAGCSGGFGGGGGGYTDGGSLSGGHGASCAGGGGGSGYYGGGGGVGDCGGCSGGSGGGGSGYYNSTYMTDFGYTNPTSRTGPNSSDVDYANSAATGGSSCSGGSNGLCVVYIDGTKYATYSYTGSTQTFTIS